MLDFGRADGVALKAALVEQLVDAGCVTEFFLAAVEMQDAAFFAGWLARPKSGWRPPINSR